MKKYNNLCFVLGIVLLLSITYTSAANIQGADIKIRIWNGTTVEIINPDYSANNQNFTISNSVVNQTTNSTNNSDSQFQEFDYSFLFIKNDSVGSDIVSQLTQCLGDKSQSDLKVTQFNSAWDQCRKDLMNYNDSTSKFVECQGTLATCKSDAQTKDDSIKKLTDDKNANSNQPWVFGIGGIIVGIVGWRIYKKELFNGTPNEKSNEYNPRING